LRTLKGAGFSDVSNILGGHISLQRQARTSGFKHLQIDLLPVESKSIEKESSTTDGKTETRKVDQNSRLVVDVRTPEEYRSGAYPESVNIPLDELMERYEELGSNPNREIIVYCASGARSAYAQRLLAQMGYANVRNGGGIASMMAGRNSGAARTAVSNEPLVVDVRTPEEFAGGAYPGAVNLPLDELQARIGEIGGKNREITLYCASGARSAYGQRFLQQMGYTNVRNGGGIMQMMRRG
jgi:rhodanese-related sulfurtransferase